MEVWWIEYKGQAHRCKVEVRGVTHYQCIISGFMFRGEVIMVQRYEFKDVGANPHLSYYDMEESDEGYWVR